MHHTLPELPYEKDALEPYISAETLEFHYGKHHATYVDKLNGLIAGSEFEDSTLADIIRTAPPGPIFNNAAQIWNHTFYWTSLSPNGGGMPEGDLAGAIDAAFGGYDAFKEQFTNAAVNNFGSGWTWLVRTDAGLAIVNTSNAATPLIDEGTVPLLTCDVWEHAYYVDYRNARPKYLQAFWNLVNWEFAAANFSG